MDGINIPLLASALIFVSLCLLIFGLYQYSNYRSSRKKILSKIRHDQDEPEGFSKSSSGFSQADQKRKFLSGFLSRIGNLVIKETVPSYGVIRTRFLQAGIRNPNAVYVFWGIKLLLAVLLTVLFLLAKFYFHIPLQQTHFLLITLLTALIGLYLPDIWLKMMTDRRKNSLARSFPDALDLMVVCVEAGVGLDAAFNRVAQEFKLAQRELSQEFRLVNLELRAGKSRTEALNNLAKRTGLDEIKSFASLMIQTMQFGTSISQALQVYAETFRTNRRQKAEELAAKLPVKLLFPTAVCIFPALFIIILGPAVIRVMKVLLPSLGG